MVLDLETGNEEVNNRTAHFMYNDIIAYSFKKYNQPQKTVYCTDYDTAEEDIIMNLKDCNILVAHNTKFELLYLYAEDEFQEWIKGGGRIYCTQLAHYFLQDMRETYPALRDIAVRCYNCPFRLKNIEKYFKEGKHTSEIPRDELLFDVENDVKDTEQIYLKQLEAIGRRGEIYKTMIDIEMEFLLSTTEMEYNGMFIDEEEVKTQQQTLQKESEEIQIEIDKLLEIYWK